MKNNFILRNGGYFMTEKKYYKELYLNLEGLTIYRELLKDPVISNLNLLFKELSKTNPNIDEIFKLYFTLQNKLLEDSEAFGLSGNLLKSYVIDFLIKDKNFFTLTCEKIGSSIKENLYNIALNDIKIIYFLINFNLDSIGSLINYPCNFFNNYSPSNKINKIKHFEAYKDNILNADSSKKFLDSLIEYYFHVGCGELSDCIAFKWDNPKGLIGVKNFNKITLDDIVGYEYQKKILVKNTFDFISGNTANNVLLIGSAGTGKSSSVKALLNKFYDKGLRLVQISKEQLLCLSSLLNELKNRGKYFIIFIDDLSFEEFETDYKEMKSVLDGGIEEIPDNILIYATSNRRHLIKETWNDRTADEEIHISDSVNEKLSLSERFGIVLTYTNPDKEHYLAIVKSLAKKQNIKMDEDTLNLEASRWELKTHGRSGRTAKQFINYISSSN